MGNAQHLEHLSRVRAPWGRKCGAGSPEVERRRHCCGGSLWGEGARPCGSSTAWREARESVEWTGRSGAEEPEVCWRSGCRKRSGQRLASCSVKGQAVNILEPVGPTPTPVTTLLLFVRSRQLSTVHK